MIFQESEKKALTKFGVIYLLLNSSLSALTAQPRQPVATLADSTLQVVFDPHAFATLNSTFQWELEWTPPQKVLPGTQIELRSANLRTYYEWQYPRLELDKGDIVVRRPGRVTSDDVFALLGKWTIFRAVLPYGLKAGEPLRIKLGAIPPRFSNLADVVSVWRADYQPPGQDSLRQFSKVPNATERLHVNPAPVERLGVYARPMAGTSGKVRIVLAPEDRYCNPRSFRRAIPVKLSWEGREWSQTIDSVTTLEVPAPRQIGRLRVSVALEDLSTQENIANATRMGNALTVTSNPVWAKAMFPKTAAFGEFHWHTEISGDGANDLTDGLISARDHFNLDYATPSDHTPDVDEWKYSTEIVEKFNAPGTFVTIFGWENSTNEGHDNYYTIKPDHPIRPHGEANVRGKKPYMLRDQLEKLSGTLRGRDRFIAIPHHTNAVAETSTPDGVPYWFSYDFRQPDSYHRLIEIFQTRGNMERNEYTDAWRGWYANQSSAQDALAKGYKLGFTAGTDNHTGKPVYVNTGAESLGRLPLHSQSVSGVWVDDMTRDDVFDGMYQRHTWACWDTRAILAFSVNDALMGSEIKLKKGTKLNAHLTMSAEDVCQSIEVVSDNEVVWSSTANAEDLDLNIDLGVVSESTWFYVRILLRNGGIVYGSPVFIEIEKSVEK